MADSKPELLFAWILSIFLVSHWVTEAKNNRKQNDFGMENPTTVPIVMTGGVILATAVYFLYQFWKRNNSSHLKLLENPKEKYSVALIEREDISHDTRRFRFSLPSPDHILGLPIGQHVYMSTTLNGKYISRSYTPITSDDDFGYVDFVIKVYFANVHPKFPEGGKLTQFLENMKIGDTINIAGPNGSLIYNGCGKFNIKSGYGQPFNSKNYAKVAMIAGGTGITPMLQIIRHVFKDPNDNLMIWLLYANQTEKDILLRKELEEVRDENPERFHLWYTLDRPSDDWQYSTGFINDEMISKHFPPPSNDTIILMCGPPPMIKHACIPNLDKLGYSAEHRFAY